MAQKSKLTIVQNHFRDGQQTNEISQIIGRDNKEFLKRNPPVFDTSKDVRLNFWNHGLKWLHTFKKVDRF